ncbi:MAG: lipopolysaccharide biosynthesis protein [Acidobacteria bacterium]|nr:MAG: lipopolysaccharide biosynthesis protein [Acidobacteriota bacterium]
MCGRKDIGMIQNRELTMDDYLGMLRRRIWVILVPALIAPAIGFGISYLLAAKYTSTATVLVEGQKVSEKIVTPITTEDVMQRITTLKQQVLSRNRLQPIVDTLGLQKGGDSLDDVLDDIRKNVDVQPVEANSTPGVKRKPGQNTDVPGFTVSYTAPVPRIAQQVCNQITSMLLEENLKSRQQAAQGTTEFLSQQIEQAKRDLDEQDAKLANFKRQYAGQLPGDADNNMKILMGLNSQLDANTQTINRAQQDRTYAESQLAQQLGAWKSSESTTSPQALEQQLAVLQNQLIQLQGRYTADHPDVFKTKADIAQLQKKLDEVNSAKPDPVTEKANMSEPPEIRQTRVQLHQFEQTIAQATATQKKLEDQIKLYQGRVSLSPSVEEQYKQLTRDYDTEQKVYDDLLAKKNDAERTADAERQQQGEQFRLLNPASIPTTPSFPNRLMFAGGGLGVGLVIGMGIALWFEMSDKSIRNELDVEAVMELPMLISLPWVGEEENKNGKKTHSKQPRVSETVEV